jgi:hypothetical protein
MNRFSDITFQLQCLEKPLVSPLLLHAQLAYVLRTKLKSHHFAFTTIQNEDYFKQRSKLYFCLKEEEYEEAQRMIIDGAPPTHMTAAGSSLFLAVKKRKRSLVRLMLYHPHVKAVINGTTTSWAPFPTALVMGETEIAIMLMAHPDLDFSVVHWQFAQYVLCGQHPEKKARTRKDEMVRVLIDYFERRKEQGYLTPSYAEFKNSCVITCQCIIA